MQLVANGDKDAFKVLIQRYQSKVFQIAYRFCGDKETAEDLTQDVFLNVYKHAPFYKPKAKFYTWLYQIVVNRCINYLKKDRGAQSQIEDHNLNSVASGSTKVAYCISKE